MKEVNRIEEIIGEEEVDSIPEGRTVIPREYLENLIEFDTYATIMTYLHILNTMLPTKKDGNLEYDLNPAISYNDFHESTGMNVNSVSNGLKELEAKNYIEVERNRIDGQLQTNKFKLMISEGDG